MTSVRFPLDKAQDSQFYISWCAPFKGFFCSECIDAGKAAILPHYSNPTSEEQVDLIDSDIVSTNIKLMDLLRSLCDENDERDEDFFKTDYHTLGYIQQKIMAIRRTTAAEYAAECATATIKPQPSSPTNPSTPSTSHSKPVSSPHFSNIIPNDIEQVTVKKIIRQRKTVIRSAHTAR